jgi:hypothetical protein
MKQCECGTIIPGRIKLDGKWKSTTHRFKCLACQPWSSSPYAKRFKSEEERKESDLVRGRTKVKKNNEKFKLGHGTDRANLVRKLRKQQVLDLVQSACQVCSYNKLASNLAFHHLHSKEFDLSERSFQFGWPKLIPEISKCVLVCHNCHGEIHNNLIDPAKVQLANQTLVRALLEAVPELESKRSLGQILKTST